MLIVFLGVMPVTEILAFLLIILKARMEEYLEHCLYYGWRIKVCVLRHDILNPCIYFKFYDKYIHWTDKYTYSCQMTVFRLSLYLSRNMTKSTIWHMRPAVTQKISLGIHPVWSRPNASLCGQRRLWSDWADAQADLSSLCAHAILLVLSWSGSFIPSFAMTSLLTLTCCSNVRKRQRNL